MAAPEMEDGNSNKAERISEIWQETVHLEMSVRSLVFWHPYLDKTLSPMLELTVKIINTDLPQVQQCGQNKIQQERKAQA